MLKQVEPIRTQTETVIKEDLETLASLRLLDKTLRSEAKIDKCRRKQQQRGHKSLDDVDAAIFQINLWNSSRKYGSEKKVVGAVV